jgi:hypothetical protein
MYAALRRYDGVPDSHKAGELVAEGFVPLMKGIRGFVAYYWVDAGDGVMFSTSVFDDQEAAEESVRVARDWVRDHPGVLPNPPEVTAGEVVVHGEK